MSQRCLYVKGNEHGFTLWEVCLSLALVMGWVSIFTPFIVQGNERIERLEKTVRIYERLQGEVLREAVRPTGAEEICEDELCLPTL